MPLYIATALTQKHSTAAVVSMVSFFKIHWLYILKKLAVCITRAVLLLSRRKCLQGSVLHSLLSIMWHIRRNLLKDTMYIYPLRGLL